MIELRELDTNVHLDTHWLDTKNSSREAIVQLIQLSSRRFSAKFKISDDDVFTVPWVVQFGQRLRVQVACGPDLSGLGAPLPGRVIALGETEADMGAGLVSPTAAATALRNDWIQSLKQRGARVSRTDEEA